MAESTGGAVDFAHLERYMAGDRAVMGEILAIFRQQALTWGPGLADDAPNWRETVHTIKGAGRGIGAFVLGDVCERAEREGPGALPRVREALAAAVAEIEAFLAQP